MKERKEEWVLNLDKVIDELKQAPRAWSVKLDDTMKSIGFIKEKMTKVCTV